MIDVNIQRAAIVVDAERTEYLRSPDGNSLSAGCDGKPIDRAGHQEGNRAADRGTGVLNQKIGGARVSNTVVIRGVTNGRSGQGHTGAGRGSDWDVNTRHGLRS